jgi:hypothetical protein
MSGLSTPLTAKICEKLLSWCLVSFTLHVRFKPTVNHLCLLNFPAYLLLKPLYHFSSQLAHAMIVTPSRLGDNMKPALAFRPDFNTNSGEAGANSNDSASSFSGSFTILNSDESDSKTGTMSMHLPLPDSMRLAVTGLKKLDGEYLLVAKSEPAPTATTSTMDSPTRATQRATAGPETFLGSASRAGGKADALLGWVVACMWVIMIICVV